MTVKDILEHTKISFSFEFFPPKSDTGWEKLYHTITALRPLNPSYVSVTYGAGGSTRDRTHDIVTRIKRETDLTVVSHLTCAGSTKSEIAGILDRYAKAGIDNILALRGDLPANTSSTQSNTEDFRYAVDLIYFVKKHYPEMCVGVAGFPEGHPQSPNRLVELEFLKEKVDAGADYIVSQLFFDNHDFYDYRDRCELGGIEVPILAGIMPITSKRGMLRMSELASRARFPSPLLKLINRADTDEFVEKAGVHWASEQVRDLVDKNVRGIHFYTLNQSTATLRIYESLGVRNSDQFGL